MATTDYSLAHSLPANVEAERSILGAILLDNFSYNQAAEHLKPEDFSLDSHRIELYGLCPACRASGADQVRRHSRARRSRAVS